MSSSYIVEFEQINVCCCIFPHSVHIKIQAKKTRTVAIIILVTAIMVMTRMFSMYLKKRIVSLEVLTGSISKNNSNNAYEIIGEKKNLFMLPSGAARKRCVTKATYVMKLWIYGTPLKLISLKAVHVMSKLLPRKPRKYSNTTQSAFTYSKLTIETLEQGFLTLSRITYYL